MHLLYSTGSGLHMLSPLLSWALVLGAAYGLVHLMRDAWRAARRYFSAKPTWYPGPWNDPEDKTHTHELHG